MTFSFLILADKSKKNKKIKKNKKKKKKMAANFTENDFKLMKDGGEQGEKTIQEFFNDVERFSNNCRRIFKNTKTKIY